MGTCAFTAVASAIVSLVLSAPQPPLQHGEYQSNEGNVEVILYFVGDSRGTRWDPAGDDSRHLRLQIKNASGRSITLPEGYDGAQVQLYAYPASESGYPASDPMAPILLRLRGKKPTKTIEVGTKEYADICSLPLDSILKYDGKDKDGKPASDWEWKRSQPMPRVVRPDYKPTISVPASEFQKEPVILFWAEVKVDKQVLRTRPIILKVWQH
jgi:hypothetical protein